jgi:ribosomal protein L21E
MAEEEEKVKEDTKKKKPKEQLDVTLKEKFNVGDDVHILIE